MNFGETGKPLLLRSSDMSSDEFAALFMRLYGNLYADMQPLGEGICIAGVYGRFDGLSVRRMQYKGDFTIRLPAPQDEITFVLPTAGKIIFDHRSQSIGTGQVGLAVDKLDIRSIRIGEGHAHCGLSICRSAVTQRLSTLLDRPLPTPIRFADQVELNKPAFKGVSALLSFATGTQFDPLINTGVLLPARLKEMLVDALLETWPHNYSQAMSRPVPAIAPRHVKRAMAYLREHPAQQLSGSELATLANVSVRALQDGFRRFAGVSIIAFQRQVRLEQAREVLARGEGGSVAQVALQHGFSNAGRFARYFQQAFGVTPAMVRRR